MFGPYRSMTDVRVTHALFRAKFPGTIATLPN